MTARRGRTDRFHLSLEEEVPERAPRRRRENATERRSGRTVQDSEEVESGRRNEGIESGGRRRAGQRTVARDEEPESGSSGRRRAGQRTVVRNEEVESDSSGRRRAGQRTVARNEEVESGNNNNRRAGQRRNEVESSSMNMREDELKQRRSQMDDRTLNILKDFYSTTRRMNIYIPLPTCTCGNRRISSEYTKYLELINPEGEHHLSNMEALDRLHIYDGCCRQSIIAPGSFPLNRYLYNPSLAAGSHIAEGKTENYSNVIDWKNLPKKNPNKPLIGSESSNVNFSIDSYGNIIGKGATLQTYVTIPTGSKSTPSQIPVIRRVIVVSDVAVEDSGREAIKSHQELLSKTEGVTDAIKRSDVTTVLSLVDNRAVRPTLDQLELAKAVVDDLKSREKNYVRAKEIVDILSGMIR